VPMGKGKGKSRRWPCESSREIVYFNFDEGTLGDEQQRKLCDLVSQLKACPELSACVAGRAKGDENPGYIARRGEVVKQFLDAQGADRFQVVPQCTAPAAEGSWADIYLEEK
jgi:outer membrane protein OmpA-like peptidoglycan-associated protein